MPSCRSAQQTQVDAQRKANTIALARYRVGYASYFNVIDADRDLFTAELSLSAAHLNTLLSLVQLYRAARRAAGRPKSLMGTCRIHHPIPPPCH